MKKIILLMAAIVFLCLGGIDQAYPISYTVEGWGPTMYPGPVTPPANAPWGPNGYPGDTVEFQTFTGTLDLTPGISTQKINTLLWTIDYTYAGTATDPDAWSDLSFNPKTVRNISFDGGATKYSLSQNGLLEVTWDNDYLSFSNGTTTTIVVAGYRIDITPLGLATAEGVFSGGNPWVQPSREVMARFEVTAVPEPGILILLGIAMSAIGAASWRLRKL